jgi:Flp pilus assembly protein TadG
MDRTHPFHRFGSDARGSAAVEFALILPIMLLVYIGTMEASALISMDRRVQSVTGALGDLVARTRDEIDDDTMRDYFQAASGIMTPFSAAGLEQVVTQVSIGDDGNVTVDWSRQYIDGEYAVGEEHGDGDPFTLPPEMIAVSGDDGYVIVAESRYAYTPLVGIVFDAPINLYRENFYVPRFGGPIAVAASQ